MNSQGRLGPFYPAQFFSDLGDNWKERLKRAGQGFAAGPNLQIAQAESLRAQAAVQQYELKDKQRTRQAEEFAPQALKSIQRYAIDGGAFEEQRKKRIKASKAIGGDPDETLSLRDIVGGLSTLPGFQENEQRYIDALTRSPLGKDFLLSHKIFSSETIEALGAEAKKADHKDRMEFRNQHQNAEQVRTTQEILNQLFPPQQR